MSQTSYDLEQPVAVNGLIADAAGLPKSVLTYNNPVDEIKFGRAVAKVSGDDNGVEKPDSSGAILVGVAVRDISVEEGSTTAENAYPATSAVGVMRRGQVWVQVEEAVTPDDAVFVRHTANGPLTELGIFRTDADTANAIALTTAKFMTSAAAGGLAVLDLNIA